MFQDLLRKNKYGKLRLRTVPARRARNAPHGKARLSLLIPGCWKISKDTQGLSWWSTFRRTGSLWRLPVMVSVSSYFHQQIFHRSRQQQLTLEKIVHFSIILRGITFTNEVYCICLSLNKLEIELTQTTTCVWGSDEIKKYYVKRD